MREAQQLLFSACASRCQTHFHGRKIKAVNVAASGGKEAIIGKPLMACNGLILVILPLQDATGKAADIAVGWAIAVGSPFAFGEMTFHAPPLPLTSLDAINSPARQRYGMLVLGLSKCCL